MYAITRPDIDSDEEPLVLCYIETKQEADEILAIVNEGIDEDSRPEHTWEIEEVKVGRPLSYLWDVLIDASGGLRTFCVGYCHPDRITELYSSRAHWSPRIRVWIAAPNKTAAEDGAWEYLVNFNKETP